jgi:hypothetical protein
VFSAENISRKKKHPNMKTLDNIRDILLDKALNTTFENNAARNSVAPNTKRSRYILY